MLLMLPRAQKETIVINRGQKTTDFASCYGMLKQSYFLIFDSRVGLCFMIVCYRA